MKKFMLVLIAVLMIVNGLVVTGCGNKDKETKLRDYHGYYGEHAWSACEEDHESYANSGVEVSEIMEEFIYGEQYYYFYTYITIAD